MADLRTPLAKARGLGSAKDGVHHFWAQRMTALALIPLVLWFCFSLASLPSMDHATFTAWLSSPFNAVLMICTLIAGFYHAALGCQVVIEDYVGCHAKRMAGIILVNGLCFLMAVAAVLSVVKVAVGG